MTTRRPLGLSLIAGMFGGLLVVAVVLVVVAASGGVGSSAKTVVVQEAPIAPASTSAAKQALTAREVYARNAPGLGLSGSLCKWGGLI